MKKFSTLGRKFKDHAGEKFYTEPSNGQPEHGSKLKRAISTIGRKSKGRPAIADMATEFAFRPINIAPGSRSFRLLKLLPGEELDIEIKFEIFHSSLDQNPTYEALSYAQRKNTRDMPVYIHGLTRHVTADLFRALRHLRFSDRIRTLWIDVLCVDMQYIPEKAHQVGLVRSIYRGAEKVVAWLGSEGETTRIALDFCEHLSKMDKCHATLFKEQFKIFHAQWEACETLFFGQPWWRRQWTIPEVCHDKPVVVYIGKFHFTIEKLYELFQTYYSWLKITTDDSETDFTAEKRIELSFVVIMNHRATHKLPVKNGQDTSCLLPTKLHWFRGRRAQNPRDHLFVHFGLCPATCQSHTIDYKISKEALYTKYTRQFLETSAFSLLLVESIGRIVSWKPQSLPSWVPDFSVEQPCLARAMVNFSNQFEANEGFPSDKRERFSYKVAPLYLSTETQLTIQGIFAATVTKIYRTKLQYPESTAFLVPGGEQTASTLFDYVRTPFIQAIPALAFDPIDRHGTDIDETNTSWGPCGTKVGDIIIVAEGSRLPLVLRKHDFKNKYLLLGACVLIDFSLQCFGPGEVAAIGALQRCLDNNSKYSRNEPGFSDIMFGTACGAAVAGHCLVEEFVIE
jgi:hypothetical protein